MKSLEEEEEEKEKQSRSLNLMANILLNFRE